MSNKFILYVELRINNQKCFIQQICSSLKTSCNLAYLGIIFCQDFILNEEKEFLICVYTHDFSNYLYLNIDYHNEDIQFHILQMETLLFPGQFSLSALGCLWYFLKEVIHKHHKDERMHCTCCGAGIFHSTNNFKSVYVFQCSNHPFNCKNNTSNLHNISIL